MARSPEWRETPLDSPVTRVAIPIISVRGNVCRLSGTACVIAPWLAITARHVIESEFRAFGGTLDDPTGTYEALHRTFALTWPRDGKPGMTLHVVRSWCSSQSDLAALWLAPDRQEDVDCRWSCPILSLNPPCTGTNIAAFGFPKSETAQMDANQFNVSVFPMTSTGHVTEVHHAQRDRGLLPFPCFRTNARFDPGMSGGPVFDEKGRLCGLVCASLFSPGEPSVEHISYVSTLWPLLSINIDMPWDRYPSGARYPLYRYAEAGIVRVEGLDFLEVREDPAGSSVTFRGELP
jgi:hypothetical protein